MSETNPRTDQEALLALQGKATSGEDLSTLAEWQEEIDGKAERIGRLLTEHADPSHVVMHGVAEGAGEIDYARGAGHEITPNTYGPSGRH